MKVAITFDFNEYARRAVNHHYGDDGPASYDRMRSWVERVVDGEMETLSWDLQVSDEVLDESRNPEGGPGDKNTHAC